MCDELAPIRIRLAVIEEKIALLPDLHFLHSSQVALQVMAALRKTEAKPPEPHVGLTVRREILAGCDGRREGADYVLVDLSSGSLPRRPRL